MNGTVAPRLAHGTHRAQLASAAVVAIVGVATLAVLIAFSRDTPLALVGPGVIGLLCLWMVATARYELTLAVLALYIALIDGYLRAKTGQWNLTILRDLLLYSIVVGAAARLMLRSEPVRLPPLTGWVLAFVTLALVQLANPASPRAIQAMESLRPHLEWVPIFFLGYATLRTNRRLRALLVLLVIVAAVNGVVATIQFQLSAQEMASWGPGYAERLSYSSGAGTLGPRLVYDAAGGLHVRPFGLGSDMGFAGGLAILAIPGLLALLGLRRHRWLSLLLLPISIGIILGVATSQSRTAVIGTLISAGGYAVLAVTSRRVAGVLLGIAAAVVVTWVGLSLVGSVAGPGAFQHFQSIVPDRLFGTTVQYRQDDLRLLPQYIAQYPLGAGLGSGGPAASVTGGGTHAGLNAETELNFLVIELGIAGLLVFVGFSLRLLVLAVRTARSIADRESQLLVAGLTAPLLAQPPLWISGITSSAPPFSPYLWLAAGALAFWAMQTPAAGGTVTSAKMSLVGDIEAVRASAPSAQADAEQADYAVAESNQAMSALGETAARQDAPAVSPAKRSLRALTHRARESWARTFRR